MPDVHLLWRGRHRFTLGDTKASLEVTKAVWWKTRFPLAHRTACSCGATSSITTTQRRWTLKSWRPRSWTGWGRSTAWSPKIWKALRSEWIGWSGRWSTWSPRPPRGPVLSRPTRWWSRRPGGHRSERKRRRKTGQSCTPECLVSFMHTSIKRRPQSQPIALTGCMGCISHRLHVPVSHPFSRVTVSEKSQRWKMWNKQGAVSGPSEFVWLCFPDDGSLRTTHLFISLPVWARLFHYDPHKRGRLHPT